MRIAVSGSFIDSETRCISNNKFMINKKCICINKYNLFCKKRVAASKLLPLGSRVAHPLETALILQKVIEFWRFLCWHLEFFRYWPITPKQRNSNF